MPVENQAFTPGFQESRVFYWHMVSSPGSTCVSSSNTRGQNIDASLPFLATFKLVTEIDGHHFLSGPSLPDFEPHHFYFSCFLGGFSIFDSPNQSSFPQCSHNSHLKGKCEHVTEHMICSWLPVKLIDISGPTKWRLPQWSGPHHRHKPKSAGTYRKHLSRESDTHQSRSSSPALATSADPREQGMLAL